jgi:hypothetical protein
MVVVDYAWPVGFRAPARIGILPPYLVLFFGAILLMGLPMFCLDKCPVAARKSERVRKAPRQNAGSTRGGMRNNMANYRLLIFMISLLLYLCCDGDIHDDHYDYLASSYIDTVLIGDSLVIGENVSVIHVYPYGCNSFERLDCVLQTDTLLLTAIYRFKYEGIPCVHGSGLSTTQHTLCFGGPGDYIMKYQRDESNTVYQSVFAE